MMPWGMVLREIACEIEFAGSPEKVELLLLNAIFHPPISHVEGLREFLAHFRVEDALGSAVVCFE